MEFKGTKPKEGGAKQGNSKENQEVVASKIVSKIIAKYGEDKDFFSYGKQGERNLDVFRSELAREFGDFDPREIYKQLNTKREFFEKNDKSQDFQDIKSSMAFFDPTTLQLDELLFAVEQAENIEDKKAQLKNLKKQLTELLNKRKYKGIVHGRYGDKDEKFILTFDNYVRHSGIDFTVDMQTGVFSTHDIFKTYVETIIKNENEFKFKETMPSFDLENFEKEKEIFGAKGAFMEILNKLKDNKYFNRMLVPEFTRIPADIYMKWKSDQDVSQDLARFHLKKFKNKDIIVRSSAVYSEDNEGSTGAGVYESIVVPANRTAEDFKNTVLEVYKSVNSEAAKKYRQEKGITQEEKMGIVVQEHVDSDDNTKGYINSTMLNRPELMDVGYDNGLRPVINKEKLEEAYYLENDHRNILHYQFDLRRKYIHTIQDLAELTLKLETYFKFPIQIEFIEADEDVNSDRHGTYVLQARFLPKNFGEKIDINFPEDQEPILEGMSLGAIDQELDVLDNEDIFNNDKEGIVIFLESYYASMKQAEVLRKFPNKGAVMVLNASRTYGGHIETLCAEKGITLIFDTYGGGRSEIFKHKRLRVVSNGLEAKIYEVKN